MDMSTNVPVSLKMCDIQPWEHSAPVDTVGDPMATDKMDIDEPNNYQVDDDGNGNGNGNGDSNSNSNSDCDGAGTGDGDDNSNRNDNDDGNPANDAVSRNSKRRAEIEESGDSSESYAGESSSSSESCASDREEEQPPQKLGNKLKAKKLGGHETASQSLAADASQSVMEVASKDRLQSFLDAIDNEPELTDVDEDVGNPSHQHRAGKGKGTANKAIDRGKYILDICQRNIDS